MKTFHLRDPVVARWFPVSGGLRDASPSPHYSLAQKWKTSTPNTCELVRVEKDGERERMDIKI